MSASPPSLDRAPEARAETVEDLVRLVRKGQVRIPSFQSGLRWGSTEVLNLFDSIHRGLPIGSLLLLRRRAEAGHLNIGPLKIDVPMAQDAWWVVDGQQRLTSLAASLTGPHESLNEQDLFSVAFDPVNSTFHHLDPKEERPSAWVPVSLLLDAASLGEWLEDWPRRSDKELKRHVYQAGKRIREYRVPLYIVDTEDDKVVREIFFRVNNYGKRLEWKDVYNALYGEEDQTLATLGELAAALAKAGLGLIEERTLTTCLIAMRGLDVTRSLAEHHKEQPDALKGAMTEALPVLRSALSFLRSGVGIPHLRLLPRALVLEILARFFYLHPDPNPRTKELLRRWVWRVLLSEGAYDERTLRRHGVSVLATGDAEEDLQALLRLVPREPQKFEVPERFDARSAASRLALLALASLRPRSITDGAALDLGQLIEQQDANAYMPIIRPGSKELGTGSVANRALHPGKGSLRQLLRGRIASHGVTDEVLASHAINGPCAQALLQGRVEDFFRERKLQIAEVLHAYGDERAGWRRADRDRPSIRHLLATLEDAEDAW